jgi:hypothetical protein
MTAAAAAAEEVGVLRGQGGAASWSLIPADPAGSRLTMMVLQLQAFKACPAHQLGHTESNGAALMSHEWGCLRLPAL